MEGKIIFPHDHKVIIPPAGLTLITKEITTQSLWLPESKAASIIGGEIITVMIPDIPTMSEILQKHEAAL